MLQIDNYQRETDTKILFSSQKRSGAPDKCVRCNFLKAGGRFWSGQCVVSTTKCNMSHSSWEDNFFMCYLSHNSCEDHATFSTFVWSCDKPLVLI